MLAVAAQPGPYLTQLTSSRTAMSERRMSRAISALLRVRRSFADVILSDAELGDLRLISRNGRVESACPVTR
jgi:hypothetical protein